MMSIQLALEAFIPHGHCYLWRPDLVWLNVCSDALIGLAYFSIPLMLMYVIRRRQDVPFPWLFLLFGAFIVSCGSTHLIEVWTIWHPTYWLSTGLKAFTAGISVFTAAIMLPALPKVLSLRSPTELETINQCLKHEINEKQQAEAEIVRLNQNLESRILERTAALEASNREIERLLNRERRTLEQVEQAKANAENYSEQLNAIFEQAAIGISQVALDGRWLQVNQKLCDIVGYSRSELLSKTFQDITYAEDNEGDRHIVETVLAGADSISAEKRYVHKDGHLIWVKITVSLVRQRPSDAEASADGASSRLTPYPQLGLPKYFVGIVEEIGDRKRAEIALQQQTQHLSQINYHLKEITHDLKKRNEELDQFAYVVSHDLKAPLRGIANLADWLLEDLGDALDENIQRQLDLMGRRVQRMQNLIDGLLTYCRVGRIPVDSTPVVVQALLQDTVDGLAIPPEFRLIIQPHAPTLVVAPLLLQQVFSNLITNAIKHHDKSTGQIQISWCDSELGYHFSVSDDGPGIDAAYHRRIFQIFQTLDPRDVKENTGVGLSIVKKIVESLGGSITVESQEGRGTAFHFTWPKRLPASILPAQSAHGNSVLV